MTAATLLTVDEFLKLPDPPNGRYELHHGEPVLTPPPTLDHVRIQAAIFELLREITRGKGFRTVALPFRPAQEHEMWVADYGFIFNHRWKPQAALPYFMGAPDLVIEVLSPSNTMDEMLEKQNMCLMHGCVGFWIVNPKLKQVLVTGSGGTTHYFSEDMSIPLPAPLDGRVQVRDIFDPNIFDPNVG